MSSRRITVVLAIIIIFVFPRQVLANEENKWNIGSAVNTGKDNGYSGNDSINSDDPHYGWVLGQFYIEGYSGRKSDDDGNPILLKNVGDQIRLMFDLQQDIERLNGIEDLYITETVTEIVTEENTTTLGESGSKDAEN